MKKILILLLALILFLIVVGVLFERKGPVKDLPEVSEQVAPLDIEDEALPEEEIKKPPLDTTELDIFYTLDGKEFNYVDIIAHPKTVLFIWTTKCGICKDYLVELSQNCTSYEGVNLFFINAGESQERVERFISYYDLEECISDKILLDKRGYTASKFYIFNVPTVIFFKYGTPIYKSYTLNDYLIEKAYEED